MEILGTTDLNLSNYSIAQLSGKEVQEMVGMYRC